jgi:hypothetical protein
MERELMAADETRFPEAAEVNPLEVAEPEPFRIQLLVLIEVSRSV